MKTIKIVLPALLLIFILVPGITRAHDETTKVIKKEFTVNPDARLLLDNKFGQIHCNTWDKNLVAVEIRITVGASNPEKAERLLNLVTIASEGTPAAVQIRTVLDKDFSDNKKLNIDYTVNMPSSINLNLTNKFGDVFLNELSGKGNFSISYGNLEINKLMNSDNVVNINFGKGDIHYITGAMVSVKYSDLQVEYAGSLFVSSKFSNLEGNKVVSLSLNYEGGKVDLENVSVVSGNTKFTDLSFSNILKKIDLDIQYGNCDVSRIAEDFTLVSFRNKYANVSVDIPSGTSYSLEADLKFCDLDFPEEQADFTQRITTNTSKSYRASIGKKPSPEAKVIIHSEFGNVSLQ
jgi:hypothetical protein